MEGQLNTPGDPATPRLPLRGLRVVETPGESTATAGRLLADLGADVVLVEPPEGCPARREAPWVDGESVPFAVRNANKRSAVLDLESPSGQQQLVELLGRADVWLDSATPRSRAGTPLDPANMRRTLPGLVIVSITPFGQTGPYRDHAATHPVLFALSGLLALSRLPDRPPLLPPGRMAYDIGGAMAAYLALVAVWRRLESGAGDHVEMPVHAAMVQAADAILPVADVVTRAGTRTYPVYRCRDGVVRLVLLTPRHSAAMSSWLAGEGTPQSAEPAELDAKYRSFFAERSTGEVVEEAQRRGIPLSPIMRPADLLAMREPRQGGEFVDAEVLPGRRAWVPAGYFEVDHHRAGFRQRAPRLGEHTVEALPNGDRTRPAPDAPARAGTGLPLRGLLVLDFGLVYAGPEVGKLLADHGADVIKVETRTSPDLTRLAGGERGMTAQFVTLNRNKRSLGVNLRTEQGSRARPPLGRRWPTSSSRTWLPGALAKLGLDAGCAPRVERPLGRGQQSTVLTGRGPEPLARLRPERPRAGRPHGTVALPGRRDRLRRDDLGVPRLPRRPARCRRRAGRTDRRRSSGRGQSINVPQVDAVMNYLSDVFAAASLEPPSGRRRARRPEARGGCTDAPATTSGAW